LRRSRKFAVLHEFPRNRIPYESFRCGLRGSPIIDVQQRCDIAIAGV
jgi:hypothetical protein